MNAKQYDSILSSAIAAEIEAQHFYAEVAARVTGDFLKKMFLDFVEEERKHEKILIAFRQRADGHLHFKGAADLKISETIPSPPLSVAMKPADAIAIAMKKEEEAMNHYTDLAKACSDQAQRQVFFELASMEREHKNRMEMAFVDIGYPEVW
jgi:rubrerythrin